MSNTRYYARRAAHLCPECGEPVPAGVYCPLHRAAHRARRVAERLADRAGYNQYMRVLKSLKRAQPCSS